MPGVVHALGELRIRLGSVDDEALREVDAERTDSLVGGRALDALGDGLRANRLCEALDRIDAFRPDLILSDIGLPEEDGYALMRAIRSRGRQIPAIALTAYTRPEDKQTALAAGYWHHMAKPIDVTELVTTISAVAAMRGNEKD